MPKRNGGQYPEAEDVSAKPKLSKAKGVIIIVIVIALSALAVVVKLNQIFHWWLTPPW